MKKTWMGRIEKETNKEVENFTSSLNIDYCLYLYDIMGTIAHTAALGRIGIIKKDEEVKIIDGIKEVKRKIEEKIIEADRGYEDIHSLVENELSTIVGELSGKIHTGRSRNDQVALDEKLFLKDAIINLLGEILVLQKNIINISKNNIDIIIPAYTHMQKAQPVLLSHYLLSYFEKFKRDTLNLFESFENCDYLPLGAAACTGSGYDIDRELIRKLLKFKQVSSNSMDDVSDRDFILYFIYCCSLVMLHLSSFCEDLIIYNTSEFSFIDIDEKFCTGSSIMPQKKNPDVLELIRGKTSVVCGNLAQFLMLIKSLPSTYNRDLQEDKKILFNAYDETKKSINIFSTLLLKIEFNDKKIKDSLKDGFLEATDIADYLVKKGETFRTSHSIVGKLVRYCVKNNLKIKDLRLEELKKYSPYFDNDIYEKVKVESCIESKNVSCGTNKAQVKEKINTAEKIISNFENSIENLKKRTTNFSSIIKEIKKI